MSTEQDLMRDIPDAYAVIDHNGNIEYSVTVAKDTPSESNDWAQDMCHAHINDEIDNCAEGAGSWVVRPVYIGQAARQQAVPIVMPPSPYMPDTEPGSMTAYEEGEAQGRCDMWAEVKRLNAAAPQAEHPATEEDKQALLGRLVYVGEQAEQVVEPFAWALSLPDGHTLLELDYPSWAEGGEGYAIRPLFAAPPTPDVSGLVEALESIYDEDYQVPRGSTDLEVSEGRKQCIYRIRRKVKDALAAHKQEGK